MEQSNEVSKPEANTSEATQIKVDSSQQPTTEPTLPQKLSKKWLIPGLVGLVLIALAIAGYFAYQNLQLRKEQIGLVQATPTPQAQNLPSEKQTASNGQPANLKQSSIISNPLNTSSWKSTSYSLIRPNAYYSPNSDTERVYETTLTFTTPQSWSVVEKDRETIEAQSVWSSEEGITYQYQTANYIVSNQDKTLTMYFDAIQGGSAEWYPLPIDANLVATYIPNPSGGSALAWILRYEDSSSGRIRYAQALSDGEGNPLTTDDQIYHWINLVINPLDSHNSGISFTVEIASTSQDKDYGTNISTADQIVSQMAAVDRN